MLFLFDVIQQQFKIAHDHRKQVVKVMGHPTGHLTNGLVLLRTARDLAFVFKPVLRLDLSCHIQEERLDDFCAIAFTAGLTAKEIQPAGHSASRGDLVPMLELRTCLERLTSELSKLYQVVGIMGTAQNARVRQDFLGAGLPDRLALRTDIGDLHLPLCGILTLDNGTGQITNDQVQPLFGSPLHHFGFVSV